MIGSAVMLYGEMDFISNIVKPDGRWTVDELKEESSKDLIGGFRSSTMQMLEAIKNQARDWNR